MNHLLSKTKNRIIQSALIVCQLLVLALSLGLVLNSQAQAQTVTYIHTDGLGSPVAKSDASGNLIANSRTRYEPYGMAVAGTATPTIGFTGHVNDADTGLTYMQQRYYDPVAGRFLSTDPVLTDYNSGASFNRYTYANNNPYRYMDPDGRASQLIWNSKTSVTLKLQYAISDPSSVAKFTVKQLNACIARNLSGTVAINGVNVTVNAVGVNVGVNSNAVKSGEANVITVDPAVTRSSTNQVGGNQISLRGTANADVVAHELAHSAGAGDQYPGGVDASSKRIPASYIATTNNLMADVGGKANSQTLTEVVKSPTAKVTKNLNGDEK